MVRSVNVKKTKSSKKIVLKITMSMTVMKLPAIEFAINSARSSTTGFSPFQLNYGRNPSPMIWRVKTSSQGSKSLPSE